MSGSQHQFPPNFGGAGQSDMRSQFGGPQRGQIPGMSSPGQPSVGIASPQTYNVGVGMQPPADSPIQTQQLQQGGQPTPQQIQLHMQQRQQQQASQQPVENSQQPQQATSVPQQLQQAGVSSQNSPVSQQTGLQPLQQVTSSASQNVNTCLTAGDGSMQSVSQSTVGPTGAVSGAGVSGPVPQQPQYNTATLCMIGQETVQEIVSKLQETFVVLKAILPPSGLPGAANVSSERKQKLCDCLKMIRILFKRLRAIYERVNDSSQLQGTEYMHIESLIPLKEEWDVKSSEERKTSESYRLASEECKELIDQVIVKNAQVKEVVDRLRRIIWEINTMLTMRKS